MPIGGEDFSSERGFVRYSLMEMHPRAFRVPLRRHLVASPFTATLILFSLPLLCAIHGFASAKEGPETRIYLAPDDHTDYFWTADEETYRRVFIETLDYYLKLIEATKDDPAPYRAKWNCDGWLWLWEYEKNKPKADFDRLMERVREGAISSPLNALVSCYGGQPAEAVLRGMLYPGQLERRYHVRFPLAVAMENQTLPYGLSALWAGSGAQWSWRGICGCASKLPHANDRAHDIYYYRGADGSGVLMKWNSMINPKAPNGVTNQSLGGYAEARDPANAVEYVTQNAEFKRRYPYPVIGIFGQGQDDLQTLTDLFPKAARALTTPERQVIVSNEEDFFRDFEAHHAAQLPAESVTYGNEWDLYCASMAEVTARVKRAVEKLRGAEAMASLCQLYGADVTTPLVEQRDLAFKDLGLFWEHDWTGDGPVPREARAAWQKRLAHEIEAYVDALHDPARQALSRLIAHPAGSERFVVFNPLSMARDDVADLPHEGPLTLRVTDLATGRDAPFQRVERDGKTFLRVLAKDVPAVGYKVFQINEGASESVAAGPKATPQADGSILLENGRLTARVTPTGAITELRLATTPKHNWVKPVDGRAANDMGGEGGHVEVENGGPVSVTVKATAEKPLRHTTRVTLRAGAASLDIENVIEENFSGVHDWSFAFDIPHPDTHHEEVGAILRAKLVGQGGQYAERNARYDWLTLNHFADIAGPDGGVTLSNADCTFFRLGRSTVGRLDTETPALYPLMGGQVDGESLGMLRQGGDTRFTQRFALRPYAKGASAPFDSGAAMRFALERQNPLICERLSSPTVGPLPEKAFSLMTVTGKETLLWALKPAEDGPQRGIVARFFNAGSQAEKGEVRFHVPVQSAHWVTHIETDREAAPLSQNRLPLEMKTGEWRTVRVVAKAAGAVKG